MQRGKNDLSEVSQLKYQRHVWSLLPSPKPPPATLQHVQPEGRRLAPEKAPEESWERPAHWQVQRKHCRQIPAPHTLIWSLSLTGFQRLENYPLFCVWSPINMDRQKVAFIKVSQITTVIEQIVQPAYDKNDCHTPISISCFDSLHTIAKSECLWHHCTPHSFSPPCFGSWWPCHLECPSALSWPHSTLKI